MRQRLPMVFSITALLVAVLGSTPLGRAAYSAVLPRSSVGTLQLKRNAVTASKIAPNAIRTGQVVDGSLLTADFRSGQIPQGPKGDKGEKGSKGDPGVSGYQVVTETETPPANFTTIAASCPAGKNVFGGGVYTGVWANGSGPYVVRSAPNATNTGWSASLATLSSTPIGSAVSVYAICGTVDS